MRNEIDIQCLKQNLLDANCSKEMIEQFMCLMEEGDVKEQLRLLSCHRCTLLHAVREKNKKLDCLDYLIYQIKENNI